MKQAYLKCFSALLAGSCVTFVAPVMAIPTPVNTAQVTSNYDRYMKIGYAATTKRKYKEALTNFRKALKVRPNDKYALRAIDNVSRYAAALRGSIITYVPRNIGSPNDRYGGATRGCSVTNGKPLIALVPKEAAFTTAMLPSLLFYVPQNSAKRLEFILQDSGGNDIYTTNVTRNQSAGIVSLNLATFPGIPVLKNEREYRWYFTLVCDGEDRSGDISVSGFIKKVALDPILVKELQAANLSDRAYLYAANGIWYDALATLYQARLSNPNDPILSQSWAELLKSVELEKEPMLVTSKDRIPLSNEPAIACCRASSNREGLP